MLFSSCLSKNTHKTHEIVKVTVINDNNNFAPSIFRSLCEFVGDCFGPQYFSSGAALPQKNTSAQNNHLRFSHNVLKKDGAQLLLSNCHALRTNLEILYELTYVHQNLDKPHSHTKYLSSYILTSNENCFGLSKTTDPET